MSTTYTAKGDKRYKASFNDDKKKNNYHGDKKRNTYPSKKNNNRNNKKQEPIKFYKKYDPIFYRIQINRGDYDNKTMNRLERIVRLITNDDFINTYQYPDIIHSVLNDNSIIFKLSFVGTDSLTFDAYHGDFYIGVSLAIKYYKAKDPNKDLDIVQDFRVNKIIYKEYEKIKRKEEA